MARIDFEDPREDDHGPRVWCNALVCGLGEPQTCPFATTTRQFEEHDECQHEWRHVSNSLDLRFYCIHCLKIERR